MMKKKLAITLTLALLITLCACQAAEGNAQPTAAPTAAPTVAPTDAPTQAPTAEPTQEPTEAPTVPIPTPNTLLDVVLIKHTNYEHFVSKNIQVPEGTYVYYYYGVNKGKYYRVMETVAYNTYKSERWFFYTTEENATQLMRCDYDGKNQELAYTATVGTITKVSSCDAEDLQQLYVLENSTHVFKVDLNTGEKTPVVTHDQACQILTQQFGIQEDWATYGGGNIRYILAETFGIKENWNFSIGIGDYILFFDLRTDEFLRYYHDCSD